MYCPKCGQHTPDDRRFCSRCGLAITEVTEWLERGGGLQVLEETRLAPRSPRRKGTRFGAKTMFWGGMLLPIFIAFSIAVDEPGPLLVPFIVFVVGLSIWLYSRLFGEISAEPNTQQNRLGASRLGTALPPASNAGLFSDRRGTGTAEIIQPPSVTDHTTRLLDDTQKVERE